MKKGYSTDWECVLGAVLAEQGSLEEAAVQVE